MNTWISYIAVVLGVIAATSVLTAVTLVLLSQPVSEVIIALGVVAVAGLIRLLISPLNQKWFE